MNDTVVEALKWIGIVFAAGFVGYFGRHLAMMLIDKMRRKKPQPPPAAGPPLSGEALLAEQQARLEKKRAKAEAKKAKKAPEK